MPAPIVHWSTSAGLYEKTLELDGRLAQSAESRELRSATNKGQAELSDGGTLPSFHLG